MERTSLEFVYYDAGGGHRAAATALKLVIEQQQRPWDVRLVNLQELLDPIDIVRKLTRIRTQDLYNRMLKLGWTVGTEQLMRGMHAMIRRYHDRAVELLERHWRASRPDMVVSVVSHFNRAIAESARRALPGTPFVTVMTDIADYPPHFWIERESEYLVCGSVRAVEQARALGHHDERIFRTSGMVLHPRFYETPAVDRKDERRRLGLDPDLPAGLVLFGGQGSRAMLGIARRLDRSGLPLQLILVCGRNSGLCDKLRARRYRIPVFIEGFTTEVRYYMHLSDFFIGKPGPGSISEALFMNLPVIVERNAWTMPHERYNADWLLEQQAGLVVDSFRRIAEAVRTLLEPPNFERFRARAEAVENRAVFEIPDIFDQILSRRALPRGQSPLARSPSEPE